MNKLDNVGMGSHRTKTYVKAIYGAVGAVQISETVPTLNDESRKIGKRFSCQPHPPANTKFRLCQLQLTYDDNHMWRLSIDTLMLLGEVNCVLCYAVNLSI